MEINFQEMAIGDKVALPKGKWGNAQRKYYDQACAFARENSGVQFEVTGNDGSNFEPGQYWLTRTK